MRDGKVVSDFPADIMLLEGCTPVYEEFDGWSEDITNAKAFDDLPKARGACPPACARRRYAPSIAKNN